MLSQNNDCLTSAANTIYLMNADELARKRARDREDYFLDKQADKEEIARLKAANAEKDVSITEKDSTIEALAALIAELQAQLAEKNT